VDLHAFLPAGFASSSAQGISSDGVNTYIAGQGFNTLTGRDEALLWKRPLDSACGPADIGRQGGVSGADGTLDNNDFIVFINYFFAANPLADRGVQGGVPGVDGMFDNNDFIVFIDQFFAGC
ncbi:MAG: GC-type dockerin domain-anchored protein, partial [Phycisphaerales bacterium]|nr:GC-type dockerin domain-anchored protein [Phycisphaerales bacterium]